MVIGLIAGGGDLPLTVVAECRSRSLPYCIVGFSGISDGQFSSESHILWSSLGKIGSILDFFKQHNVTHVIFAGSITRPNFQTLKFDRKGFQWLTKLGRKILGGDNQLLEGIEILLQSEGFEVMSAGSFTRTLIHDSGVLSIKLPSVEQWKDIQLGVQILNTLSPFDIGQSIVIADGQVIGIEALEGTQALVERCGHIKDDRLGGVLIKCSKIGQSQKIDLPTIGPATIHQIKQAKISGIAIEANKTQILHRQEVIELCNDYDLFFVALKGGNINFSPLK